MTTLTEVKAIVGRIEQKVDDGFRRADDMRTADLERINDLEETVYGNGKPGLKEDMNTIKTWAKIPTVLLGVIVALLSVMQGLTACNTLGLAQHAAKSATAFAELETNRPAPTVPASELSWPHQTAIALQGTRDAAATASAVPLPPTPPEDTPTPTVTQTSSIVEATVVETPQGPVEVGTPVNEPLPPAGIPQREAGTYRPRKFLALYRCPSLTCEISTGGGLLAGKSYPTAGWVRNEDNELWVCEIITDDGIALICDYAAQWITADGILGSYEVNQ